MLCVCTTAPSTHYYRMPPNPGDFSHVLHLAIMCKTGPNTASTLRALSHYTYSPDITTAPLCRRGCSLATSPGNHALDKTIGGGGSLYFAIGLQTQTAGERVHELVSFRSLEFLWDFLLLIFSVSSKHCPAIVSHKEDPTSLTNRYYPEECNVHVCGMKPAPQIKNHQVK